MDADAGPAQEQIGQTATKAGEAAAGQSRVPKKEV